MNTDTIKLNRGMNNNGGAYWCQNIRPARNDGVLAGISMTNKAVRTASTPTADLSPIVNFTQIGSGIPANVFGKDILGDIYIMGYAGTSATKAMDYSLTPGASEGLMIDSNDNLVYTGSQYIGRVYSTTLDVAINASASAVDLVDASDFPIAGYAVIADLSTFEVIQWTGKSTNQLTGVTRGKYNTTASAFASGRSIYFFNDEWIDMGASLTTSTRRCIRWEDENFFVNGSVVSGYKEADGSDFATKISLSSDKTIVDMGILPTSATSYVLIGANSGENGYIYVWDGKDTQTISERELKNNNVVRMWDNFIATDNGIYRYDGTNLEPITEPIDNLGRLGGNQFQIRDMKVIKNYLLFTGGIGSTNRNRRGLWYVDLETRDIYYVLPSNYGTDIDLYGIFSTASSIILVGTSYNNGSIDSISEAPASRGSVYQLIYSPTNAKMLQLKGLKLNISVDPSNEYNKTNLDFDIIVRGYDFSRPFIKRNQLKAGETPTGSSQLIIKSLTGLGVPSVGDRIEIIDRSLSNSSDNAYATRNITAVTAGVDKYTIDVDEAFPTAVSATDQNESPDVIFNPLKKLGVGKISVEDTKLNLDGYKIQLLDQPRFKKMMFEIEVRCGDITIAPELNSLEINYEILE